uniref:Secreted protein n=1 Tax=Lepeophtheirus salmonis TaxID=72036 RepID=A0A0K2UWQ1_LEPSM
MCAAWQCLAYVLLLPIPQGWSILFDRNLQTVELFTVEGRIEWIFFRSNHCCATRTTRVWAIHCKYS